MWRRERLEILLEWRRGGGGAWRYKTQFLNDGLTTYVGPSDAFVVASEGIDLYDSTARPWVTAEAVEAILAEVLDQRGHTIA